MTMPSLSVGSGTPPSSDPPPGGGDKKSWLSRVNANERCGVIENIIMAIICWAVAIIGLVFGVGCLVTPDDMCFTAGSIGIVEGVFLSIIGVVALLPHQVIDYLRNRLESINGISVGSHSPSTVRNTRWGECLRRTYHSLSENRIFQIIESIIMPVFLLVYSLASIIAGGVCDASIRSTSTTACVPVSVMDILTSIMFVVMGIICVLALYCHNLPAEQPAREVTTAVEIGEGLPMLGNQPSPVGDESPGDQSPPD